MKKLILSIIIIVSMSNPLHSQSVTDTVGYLRDSIQANRSYFIGNQLSVLLDSLKIGITNVMALTYANDLPDTVVYSRINLAFYDLTRVALSYRAPAYIEIKFSPPISVSKEAFKRGNFLDWSTPWNQVKANFYGQFYISDLQVRGL